MSGSSRRTITIMNCAVMENGAGGGAGALGLTAHPALRCSGASAQSSRKGTMQIPTACLSPSVWTALQELLNTSADAQRLLTMLERKVIEEIYHLAMRALSADLSHSIA